MKTTVISDKTKTTEYRAVKLKLAGGFTVREMYVDNVLTGQDWGKVGGFKKSHPKVYEPSKLYFQYYENIDWLDSDLNINTAASGWYDVICKPTLITDWDEFKGFDHVICDWTGMDSNIYRIDRVTPISMWRRQDYSGGFTAKNYRNLSELQKELDALEFIRNTEIMDLGYYNGGGRALEFEYKLPYRLWAFNFKITNPLIAKLAKKYGRPSEDSDY